MNYDFLLTPSVAFFVLAFVLFGGWQIAKLVTPKWFYPLDENQKKRVAEIIMTVNLTVAVIASVLFGIFGLTTNFFESLNQVLVVFSATSFFELFKAYNVVK